MHDDPRRLSHLGLATLLAVVCLAAAAPAGAECDAGICPGDPCTITSTHLLDAQCTLDFGARDVTIAPGAALMVTEFASISAGNLTVQGKIQGKPLYLSITTSGNFRTEGRGRLVGSRLKEEGADVELSVGGDVVFAGSTVKLSGDWAYLRIEAGGTIQVDAPIKTQAWFSDSASIELTSSSIITTAAMTATGRGPGAGSSMLLFADNVTILGRLGLSRGRSDGFPLEVLIGSNGDVTLSKVLFRSGLVGGYLEVGADGDITLLGHVSAKGVRGSELIGEGGGGTVSLNPGPTGVVTIRDRIINTSCGAGCEAPGSITVDTGCYTDVSGARLSAREGGPISLGCSCIHPAGSPTCDGGCVGLDTATFDPSIPTALPPCS